MKDKMLGGNISPKCEYCEFSTPTNDGDTVLCPKKGVVSPSDHCRSFQYDPLRRTPPEMAQLDFSKLSLKDFNL